MRSSRDVLALLALLIPPCNAAVADNLRAPPRLLSAGLEPLAERPRALRGHAAAGTKEDPLAALTEIGHVSDQTSQDMVRQLSEELSRLQVEVDEQEQDCAVMKGAQERLLSGLNSAMRRASMSIASLEAKISAYVGQLAPAEGELINARENLKHHNLQCLEEAKVLNEARDNATLVAERSDKVLEQIVASCQGSSALLACKPRNDSRVLFQTARVAVQRSALLQRALSKSLGADVATLTRGRACQLLQGRGGSRATIAAAGGLPRGWVTPAKDLPPTAWEPDPVPGVPLKATEAGDGAGCGAQIRDLVDSMSIRSSAQVKEAESKLVDHQRDCWAASAPLRNEARQKSLQIRQAQDIVAHTQSSKSEFRLQMSEVSAKIHEVSERNEKQQSGCKDAMDELQNEMYRVEETRSFIAQRVFGEDAPVFQDCEVGDWSAQVCSKKCTDDSGESGQRVLTRTPILSPDNSTLAGRLSVPCPAMQQVVSCNDIPCPVDCEMGSWSNWAGCSRQCGGGEQYRIRSPSRVGLHGGMVCGVSTEMRTCNIASCQQDCVLGEWTAWEPCSRRCMWNASSTPGHASRRQRVLTKPIGGGSCLAQDERTEWRECNPYDCGAGSEPLRCTADQDIALLLDGSGSVHSDGVADLNFQRQKALAQDFVSRSALSGDLNGGSAERVRQVRFGVVVLGGPGNASIVSTFSGDRAALNSAISSAAWPEGSTSLAQAMLSVKMLFRSSSGRHGTAVVFSDGGAREPAAAIAVAQKLKMEGTRMVVILVQKAFSSERALADRNFCKIASAPCVDNVLRVAGWEDLSSQLDRFLSVICPVGFSVTPPLE